MASRVLTLEISSDVLAPGDVLRGSGTVPKGTPEDIPIQVMILKLQNSAMIEKEIFVRAGTNHYHFEFPIPKGLTGDFLLGTTMQFTLEPETHGTSPMRRFKIRRKWWWW